MRKLSSLEAIHLRFHLLAETPLYLPAYKGSTFHGGFGRALAKVAPMLYQELFDPRLPGCDAATVPKPFVLVPPLEIQQHYPPGTELACELVLIGRAVQHVSIAICAIDRLSREGLGKNRGISRISRVEVLKPAGEPQVLFSAVGKRWQSLPDPTTGQDIVAARQDLDTSAVTLAFQTRVRLQADNRLLSKPPAFPLFIARLLGRLNMLAWVHHGFLLVDDALKHDLLQRAHEVRIRNHDLVWDDWSRYSGRQKTWMKFGGLLGDITYAGDLAPFLPFLALGERLHVGGKTSFGLGKYRILQDKV